MISSILAFIAGMMLATYMANASLEAEEIKKKMRTRVFDIKNKKQLTDLMDSGVKITKLGIKINDTSKLEKDILDWTVRELVIQAIDSRAAVTHGVITLQDAIEPEILYGVVVSPPLVYKAKTLLENLQEED